MRYEIPRATKFRVGVILAVSVLCLPLSIGWSINMQKIAELSQNLFWWYPAGDADFDHHTEVYGTKSGIGETLCVFEHVSGDSWARTQTNTQVHSVWAFGYSDGDSLGELLCDNVNNRTVLWESPDRHSFPSESVWSVLRGRGRYHYPRFADLDLDHRQEILLRNQMEQWGVAVFENMGNDQYESVAVLLPDSVYTPDAEQFAVGDFDRDSWPELIGGSVDSFNSLYECTGNDNEYRQYAVINTGLVSTYTVTAPLKEMDGDSWPEFILMGTTPDNSYRVVQVWEAYGKQQYHKVWEYPLPWAMGYFNIATGDVDGDGRDEFCVNPADGCVYLFKSDAPGSYQLVWTGTRSWFCVGMRDLNDDGKDEIIYDTPDYRCYVYEDMGTAVLENGPQKSEPVFHLPAVVRGPVRIGSLPRQSTVEFFSVEGRLLRTQTMANATSWTWDLTDQHGRPVPAGTYFAVIRSRKQTTRAKLCVVN